MKVAKCNSQHFKQEIICSKYWWDKMGGFFIDVILNILDILKIVLYIYIVQIFYVETMYTVSDKQKYWRSGKLYRVLNDDSISCFYFYISIFKVLY